MKRSLNKKNRLTKSILLFVIFSFPLSFIFGAEASSTSYTITDSTLGTGSQMNSANFSLTGDLAQSSFGSWATGALPLAPGIVTSCGKITTAGTYTLGSNLIGISGPCFSVQSNDVVIEGGGHTVAAVSGNSNYAVMATSSVSGGSGYNNLRIQNITFGNFTGGVNIGGNSGTISGGNGGSVIIASSTLGNISANGGSSSSGVAGSGGSINISGTDLNISGITITANRGTGPVNGSVGSITLNGSVLVSNGQSWAGDDALWQGYRTWNFTGNAYNSGTTTGTTTFSSTSYSSGAVSGDAIFLAYTAVNNLVTIDGNSNFRGTGRVTGRVIDSLGENITTWDLINGSVLTGTLTGEIILNDTSHNNGLVIGNATFNDSSYNSGVLSADAVFNDDSYNKGTATNANFTSSSFNSVSGIPNGDPTGITDGHSISGNIIFSATTSVNFSVNSGGTWGANTTSWLFSTPGQNWTFSFSTNAGTLSGDAVFTNSHNSGSVNGISTFHTGSYNNGNTLIAAFYDNSYNIGNSTNASFYNTSINSHTPSYGTVSTRCDFYDSSLPGIGHCPINATFYHIPYYFHNSVSNSWDDLGNWWFDASSTQPALVYPQNGDTVYIGTVMDNGPAVSGLTLGSIIVASPITGGGSFSVNFTNASGPAYFYASSTNAGEVNGAMHIFGNRGFSQVNTTGTFTGNVIFHDGSWNNVSIPRNAVFYDSSYNAVNGTVLGNAEFAGTNRNDGVIVGVATIDTGATLSGSGTVQNSASNAGNLAGGIFNQIVTNIAGAVTGAITNLKEMVFNSGSYVSSSGSLSGDAQFNATSSNRGVVSGTSTFNSYSYNTGSTSNATFVGDLSENIGGIVSGIKTRLYTSLTPQLNIFRNFADGAWTIVADNTYVKLLYRNLVDLFGRDPMTTTTLVERNGGFILRPLSPNSPINSCGILDIENATYTLGSNISNYLYDSCFIVRASGVTIDGAGHSVSANSSSTSIYAVVATSTLSVDATSSAFTNLSIKNVKFTNFAHGLMGRGTDVPFGIGGNGASTTITHTVIGDIDVSGGDPTEQAGHGGDLFIETSTTTIVVSDGGMSTACGIGGNGGNIVITTDTVYATSSNKGGVVTGCPQNESPRYGYRGRVDTTVVSRDTRIAAEKARLAAIPKTASRPALNDLTQAPGLKNIFTILPNVIQLSKLKLKEISSFGEETTKKTFSFVSNLFNFLFAPLPQTLTSSLNPTLTSYLKTANFSKETDLLKIKKTPLSLPNTERVVPGLFKVTTKGLPVKSGDSFTTNTTLPISTYLTTANLNTLQQKLTVLPKTTLTITLPKGTTATFLGKAYTFTNNTLTLTTPTKPGLYTLTSPSSPLTLVIEVTAPKASVPTPTTSSSTGWFTKILNFFKF